MSDSPDRAAFSSGHDGTNEEKNKNGGTLRLLLVVILLGMLGLLALDFYSRNACAMAFGELETLVDGEQKYSPEEIHKLLGRSPDQPMQRKDHYGVETYSWRRGNLIKTEYIKVLYSTYDGEVKLYEVVRNTPPDPNDIPNLPPEKPPEPTADQPDGQRPDEDEVGEDEADEAGEVGQGEPNRLDD